MSTADDGNARAQRKADKAYAKASRPWFKKKRFWLLAAPAVLVVAGVLGGGEREPSSSQAGQNPAASQHADDAPSAQTPIVVTADKMITDLQENALTASDTYKGKRVTITGVVSNIDASGAYINVRGKNEFELSSIQVNLQDEQRDAVSGLSVGDKVKATGQVTDVGEVMGYSVDAESIE